ncbi:MAG: FAD-dependent oxidoreductase [Planctomycetaceae bacterium]|nr:FAD-dependent oxidoreductase [Planctomycetaceae bacterium]
MLSRSLAPLVALLGLLASTPVDDEEAIYDVVIYGGTSAGVMAAVQTVRMGKSVVIVAPETHLGGLTASGLGWTDSGRKEVVGGLAREFYRRLKQHYDDPSSWRQQRAEEYKYYRPNSDAMWVFEPHVAERAFEEYIAEYNIPVHRDAWLDREAGVAKDGKQITAITTLDGKTFQGRMFIDATYEGDLMAAAGVSYTVGRESNAKYGETLNGVQTERAVSHQFESPVDPYVTPGDPSSGLLPWIQPDGPGAEGAGDHRVQAYCFRLCLTDAPENRVPFPEPKGYDRDEYELLARYLDTGWRAAFKKFDPAPNRKTDTNNHGAFSTDNIGMNYDYPEASYERRREIIAEHVVYQKGLMYFLANDPAVPDDIRSIMSRWGLAKDEFVSTDNWPHQIYVREARRMVSDVVHTEHHCRRRRPVLTPIGIGSYNMDSHNVQRYVDKEGHVRNEGDVQVSPRGPYQIAYGTIVPKEDECTNLLVPVCLSASHIAYGSIRMEPVFMILAQSAATAACQAIDANVSVQWVDYAVLRKQLDSDQQVLEISPQLISPEGVDPDTLPGIVIDDVQATREGSWGASSSVTLFVGESYLHDRGPDPGTKSITFATRVPISGRYEVRLSYTANPNRSSKVPVIIQHADGREARSVNQRQRPPIDKLWVSLGTYSFSADSDAVIIVSNEGADGYVIADAVQFLSE